MASPPLSNNFEGGTNGSTIATSDTGSGNSWDTVLIQGAGGAIIYDNTHVGHGSLATKITSDGASSVQQLGWNTLGSLTGDFYTRQYFYVPALQVTVNAYFVSMAINGGSGGSCATYAWFTDGTLEAFDASTSFVTGTNGSVSIALNQLIRIETHTKPGASANGTLEWRLFNTASSTTADDTKVVTTATLGANIDSIRFGIVSTSAPASGWNMWMDDIAVSTSGWIGPVAAPLPQPAHMALARTAANF